MRKLFFCTAAGLFLAPLVGLGLLRGAELVGSPVGPTPIPRPVPRPVPVPVKPIVPEKTEGTCGTFGTQVEFVDTPGLAAQQALKEGKLVFVLHVSGNFEDPRFT